MSFLLSARVLFGAFCGVCVCSNMYRRSRPLLCRKLLAIALRQWLLRHQRTPLSFPHITLCTHCCFDRCRRSATFLPEVAPEQGWPPAALGPLAACSHFLFAHTLCTHAGAAARRPSCLRSPLSRAGPLPPSSAQQALLYSRLLSHQPTLQPDITRCRRSATFLPEVAPEQGWDTRHTIDSLIKKAGGVGPGVCGQ